MIKRDKDIIIKMTPFDVKQTVFIRSKEENTLTNVEVPLTSLASFLSSQTDVDTIHFFGNEEFIKKIKEECFTKYSMSNYITFKINE